MISCSEFVPVYSEYFKFLEEEYGKQAVIDFWFEISRDFLGNMRELVSKKGFEGMKEYWMHPLTEEGARFEIEISDRKFTIEMLECPTIGMFEDEIQHIEPYRDYCEHCEYLFGTVIRDCGYDFRLEVLGFARCSLSAAKRP